MGKLSRVANFSRDCVKKGLGSNWSVGALDPLESVVLDEEHSLFGP